MDPPDLGLWPTTKGLAGLWREQKQLVLVGLACALVYSALSLGIPIVVQHAIDHSIKPTNGHRESLWPYLGVIVLLAAIRFPINFTRRYATSRTGIRVEWRMRELSTRRTSAIRARSTTCTRPARSSRARRTTSTPSATSSAGA